MDSENSLSPHNLAKQFSKFSLIPGIVSGFVLVSFAFSISAGVLFLLEIPFTTSDQSSISPLLFMAWLTFFLGMTLSPLLIITMNSTKPFGPTSARLIDHLAIATLISSFATLVLALPNLSMALTDLNELSHGKVGWAFESGLICFAIAVLYKLIRETVTFCHNECLNVAFLTLAIAFGGMYTGPLFYLPSTIPYSYSSIIYQADCIYHFALVPVTFVLGTILLILGLVPVANLHVLFVSVISKEDFTVSTLSVGLATLLTGTFSTISVAFLNLAMPAGFRIGGPEEQ